MTKIKNTKKGMAKKTLSMSLVVAMLATSNVPVWAAEFSDGTDVAVTSETPAVEEFSDNTVETPVAEEAEEAVAAQDAASNYGYTTNITLKENGNGWAGNIGLKEDVVVKDGNGNVVDSAKYKYIVRKDGYDVSKTMLDGSDLTTTAFSINLNHDDYNHVYDVYIEITMPNGKKVGLTSNKITVSPVDISKIAAENNNYVSFDSYKPGKTNADKTQYTGAEIKLAPDTTYPVMTVGGKNLTPTDFLFSYSGDLVNYTGKDIVVTGKVKLADTDQEDPAYIGSVSGTYQITKREISVSDVTAELKNKNLTFEYTTDLKEFDASDVTVKVNDSLGLADSAKDLTYAIKEIKADGLTHTPKAVITLDTSKMENFVWTSAKADKTVDVVTSNTFKIDQRDLSKVTATLKRSYSIDELRKGITFTASDFTFKDANGNEIKLANTDTLKFELDTNVIKQATSGAGSYAKAIKITPGTADTCKNSTTADLTIVQKGLSNGRFTNTTYVTAAEEFAGEGVAVTKDTKKLGEFVIGDYHLTEGVDYTIEYANNTVASTATKKAQMIVKGIGSFEGTQTTFEFTINPATINAVKADKKEVVYNPEYTSVADYLKDLNLTVTADNAHTTSDATDVFTLGEADYTIKNLETLKKQKNELSTFTIAVEAVKDGNYTGSKDVEVTICKKSLSSEDVTVTINPESYVYTGNQIDPKEIIVKDGDEVLEAGVDYEIADSTNAVDAGTAKVTVKATATGNYKAGSTATGTFTITPAKIDDVEVSYTGATYNGTKHADASKVTLKLGDVDVTKDFDISFPTAKTANINAGKTAGTVIITAKTNKAGNYSEKTKEANFEIKQAVLTGELKAYDEAGREIPSGSNRKQFDYDGTAHTFDSVKFVPDATCVTGAMKLTEDDYEIVYADNVYGKMPVFNSVYYPMGFAFVVAKGNYVGKLSAADCEELAEDGTYVTADKTKITSIAARKDFTINRAVVSSKDITVSNGVYAGGYSVKPVVTVTYKGKTLVEGKDYELDLTGNKNLVDVTSTKSLTVVVKPINGYMTDKDKGNGKNDFSAYTFNWGIDKFDLANAELIVTGTDAEPNVKVMNGNVAVDTAEYDMTIADGKVTVTAKADSKNYTGSQTADIKQALVKPEAPMINNVKVVGNTATVVLSGESDGATGYDYVIATDRDCITNKAYDAVNKNQIKTESTFNYVGQGTYYAYCHAWTRDENGKKVFSEWSNAYPFAVSAITPSQPTITSVKANGSTVTVTYTASENADGYDVVLGTSSKKVNGEIRPVEYGTLVKKNIKGNVVTATFKNVEAGTYYAGLHAFNRTSEDGKKVFSQWSNVQKVTVK